MAGATYVLDKTYTETDANGVGKYYAVISGAADGQCMLPTAASQVALGITQEAQAKQYENVVVRKYGISRFYAKGAVNRGDPLEVSGTTGQLQKATLAPGTAAVHFILGYSESTVADGAIGFVFLSPHFVSVAAS